MDGAVSGQVANVTKYNQARLRILLVSYAFPPYNDIGHVRVGKTAKYLERFGHDVRVLTAMNQPYDASLPVEIPEEHVVRTHWWNVNRPAEVAFGGRGKVVERGLESRGRLRPLVQALRAIYRVIYKGWISFPDDQIGWLPFAIRAGSRLIEVWRPDVIYASAVPYTSLIVAHLLGKRYNLPWVAELRDLWVDFHRYHIGPVRKRIEHLIEKRVLSSSIGLVTVSKPLAELLREKYAKPTAVILNGYDPDDYLPRTAPQSNNGRLRLVYTGMVIEGKYDLRMLFEALALLEADAKDIRVEFYGRYLGHVGELSAQCGVDHLISINGQIRFRDSLRAQQEADALVLFLWTDPRERKVERGVYTGKLFEYVGAGRPILAIGRMRTVASDLIVERGLGIVCETPTQVAMQLRTWLTEKRTTGSVSGPPPEAGTGLTREAQARKLERFLADLVPKAALEP
jgi:glycosyltransferase involved in cell wall biosynthesis